MDGSCRGNLPVIRDDQHGFRQQFCRQYLDPCWRKFNIIDLDVVLVWHCPQYNINVIRVETPAYLLSDYRIMHPEARVNMLDLVALFRQPPAKVVLSPRLRW